VVTRWRFDVVQMVEEMHTKKEGAAVADQRKIAARTNDSVMVKRQGSVVVQTMERSHDPHMRLRRVQSLIQLLGAEEFSPGV